MNWGISFLIAFVSAGVPCVCLYFYPCVTSHMCFSDRCFKSCSPPSPPPFTCLILTYRWSSKGVLKKLFRMPDWCFTVTVNAGHKKAMNVLTGSSQEAVKSRCTQGSPLKNLWRGHMESAPLKKNLGGNLCMPWLHQTWCPKDASWGGPRVALT